MISKQNKKKLDSLPLFEAAGSPVPPAQKPEEPATPVLLAPAEPAPEKAPTGSASKKAPKEPTPEKAPAPPSQSSEDAAMEGRKRALRYYEKKRIVLLREKKNQTDLIFIKSPSKSSWYKAFGHSATYFYAIYAEKIGSKVKLQVDKDYQFQSREGFVSVPNIEALTEKLEKIGVKLVDKTDGIYTFAMGKRIKADEYALLRQQCQATIDRANDMIKPKEMMPDLMEDAKETFRTIFWTFNTMSDYPKVVVGQNMAGLIRDIGVEYTVICKSKGDTEAFLDFALENVTRADGYFLMLGPLRIVNDDKMLEIAGLLTKLRNQIIFEKKKLAMKKIEDEHHGRNKK